METEEFVKAGCSGQPRFFSVRFALVAEGVVSMFANNGMKQFQQMVVACAVLFGSVQAAVATIVQNGDFELPALSASGYSTPTDWTYTGTSSYGGIMVFGSSLGSTSLASSQPGHGTQAAFFDAGASQTIILTQTLADFGAGAFTVSLQAVSPIYSGGQASLPFQVLLDGSALTFGAGNATTLVAPVSADTWGSYTSNPRNVAAGSSHTLAIVGTEDSSYANVGNWQWVAIDNVSVTPTPEPGSLALLATGLIGLLAYAWRKRR